MHDQQQLRLHLRDPLPVALQLDAWTDVHVSLGNELGLWQRSAFQQLHPTDAGKNII